MEAMDGVRIRCPFLQAADMHDSSDSKGLLSTGGEMLNPMWERRCSRRLREFENNMRKSMANILHRDLSKIGEEGLDDFHR